MGTIVLFEQIQERIIEWRRDFHRFPEPGFREFRTATRVAQELDGLGFRVHLGRDAMDPGAILDRPDNGSLSKDFARAIGDSDDVAVTRQMEGGLTAVIGDLTGAPGATIAFRFDLDALPIQESDDGDVHRPTRLGFASERPGLMHACGHDGHTAIGLGLATLLAERKEDIVGTIRLVFQPAEEGAPGGAAAVVAQGFMDDVDYLICSHLGLEATRTGLLAARTRFMASSKYRISYVGTPAHVLANPEHGRSALLAGASGALSLQGIEPHSAGWFNLNVGVLNSGVAQGVLPTEAELEFGIWAETDEVHEYVREQALRIVESAGALWGVSTEIHHIGEAPAAAQEATLAEAAKEVAGRIPGIVEVQDEVACRAAEDATVMLERVHSLGGKGIYMLLGTDLAGEHHTPTFDIDEDSLCHATAVLHGLAEELMYGEALARAVSS